MLPSGVVFAPDGTLSGTPSSRKFPIMASAQLVFNVLLLLVVQGGRTETLPTFRLLMPSELEAVVRKNRQYKKHLHFSKVGFEGLVRIGTILPVHYWPCIVSLGLWNDATFILKALCQNVWLTERYPLYTIGPE